MPDHIGTWFNWPFDNRPVQDVQLNLEQNEFLEFYSEEHLRNGATWLSGGPFTTKRRFVRYQPSGAIQLSPASKPMYLGKLYAADPVPSAFEPPIFLENFGPSAYRRLNPDKSEMDLGNALYELKDLPRQLKELYNLPKTGLPDGLKSLSNYDISVTYGWLPLLSDTISLYQTQRQLAKRIDQLKRDNGRPVRRKVEMRDQSNVSEEFIASGSDDHGLYLHPNFITSVYRGGTWALTQHASTRVWASGQFRLWYPQQTTGMSDNEWKRIIISRLFGLNPTPSRIYKAMPWSWLIDWFSNVGDNLANLSTNVADRVINDYCFLMRHTETFNRITVSQAFEQGDKDPVVVSAVTESGTVLKERIAASPFGFGIKTSDLSPYQLNILGSLAGSKLIKS